MEGIIITCVRRHPEHGYWTAHINVAGETFHADRRCGSWQIHHAGRTRFALPAIAAELQARVRRLERHEHGQEATAA